MQDLSKLTPTQLLKKGNDIKARHDVLKQEIIADTHEIEKLEKRLNKKVEELQELEKNYVEIVEILNQ
jgi:uncharacterized protein YccT (UPF0319 family)